MNNERDPELEVLFAQAEADSPNGDFARKVMSGVDARRRNVLLGRLAIVVLIIALEVLLSAPIQGTVGVIVEKLGTPLVELPDSWVTTLLAPANSVAGIFGGLLLLLHFLYQKLLR